MSALGRLVISLVAETSSFQGDVGKAAMSFDRAMKQMQRGAAVIGKAVAIAATTAATGLALMTRRALNTADDMSKTAQKIGVSTEFLSQLAVQARLSGSSLDGLKTSLTRLSVNVADTVKGTGEAREAFTAMGISVKDASGNVKSQRAIFEEVIGKLASYEDSNNKTAISMKLLGKSGAELLPLINSYEETKNKAAELGLIIGTDAGKAAEKFNDTMTEIGMVVEGVGLRLTIDLLPQLQRLATGFKEAALEQRDFLDFSDAIKSAINGMVLAAVYGAVAFKTLGEGIAASVAAMAAVFGKIDVTRFTSPFGIVSEMLRAASQGSLSEAKSIISDYGGRVAKMWQDAQGVIDKMSGAAGGGQAGFGKTSAAVDRAIALRKQAPQLVRAKDPVDLEKLYQKALANINKQIAGEDKLGAIVAMRVETEKGSLKDLSRARKDELIGLAIKLQNLKDQIWVSDALAESAEQMREQQEKLSAAQEESYNTNRKAVEAQQFQIRLLNETADAVETLTEKERLRLEFEQKMAALAKSMAEDESGHGFMRARIEAEKELALNQARAIELIEERREVERNWVTGATKAFQDYHRAAMDVASQTRDLFTNAFQKMEDALLNFVKTGKLNFRDLANSIIDDLIRMQIRASITGPMSSRGGLGGLLGMLGIGGGGGFAAPTSFVSGPGGLIAGGIAEGGPVGAGRTYLVGERGPELFVPNIAGNIIPNGGMGPSVSVVQYNSFGAGVSRSELAPMLDQTRRMTEESIRSSLLRGGAFASAAGKV